VTLHNDEEISRSCVVWHRVVWYTVTKVSVEFDIHFDKPHPDVLLLLGRRRQHKLTITLQDFKELWKKAQWLLYISPGLTFKNSTFCPHTVKGKSNPVTGLDRPWVFQEAEAPRFQDSRQMKTVRLSAIRTESRKSKSSYNERQQNETLLYLCVLYGSQNKQRLFPYRVYLLVIFGSGVFCAVGSDSLNEIIVNVSL